MISLIILEAIFRYLCSNYLAHTYWICRLLQPCNIYTELCFIYVTHICSGLVWFGYIRYIYMKSLHDIPQRGKAKRQLCWLISWGIWLSHLGVLLTKQIWFIGYLWQLGILLAYRYAIASPHCISDYFVGAKRWYGRYIVLDELQNCNFRMNIFIMFFFRDEIRE